MVNHRTSNLFAFQCINRCEFVGHAIYREVFDIRELSSRTSTACFRSAAVIFFENPHNHHLWRIEQSCRWFFCTFSVSLAQRRRYRNCPEVENQSDMLSTLLFVSSITSQSSSISPLTKGWRSKRQLFYPLRWLIYVFNTKLPAILSHRRSTTVPLETSPLLLYLETYATSESTSDKISQKSCDKYRKISACIIPHCSETVSVSEVNFSCNHCFLKDQLTVCTMKLVTAWFTLEALLLSQYVWSAAHAATQL